MDFLLRERCRIYAVYRFDPEEAESRRFPAAWHMEENTMKKISRRNFLKVSGAVAAAGAMAACGGSGSSTTTAASTSTAAAGGEDKFAALGE